MDADVPARPSALSRPPSLLALAAVVALAPFALNVIVPSVPALADEFAVDDAVAQLTLTAFLVAIALGQLVVGPLSDALGRRPVLLGGIVIFIAGSFLGANAWSIEVLILARFIQAAGGSAGLVLGRAIVRDINTREGSASALGYITVFMMIAPMMAPALGGFLHDTGGWSTPFWFMVALGVGLVALVATRVGETNRGPRTPPRLGPLLASFGTLLRIPEFLFLTLTSTFASALFFTFLAGAPYITIEILGHSPTGYGIAFAATAAGYMAGNFTSARLSQRVGIERMILAGCLVGTVGVTILLGLALTGTLTIVSLFGAFALVAYSNGLVLPNAIAALISVRTDLAGAAAGLSGSIQFAFGGLASVAVGLAEDGTPVPMVLQMTIMAVLALASHAAGRRAGRVNQPAG